MPLGLPLNKPKPGPVPPPHWEHLEIPAVLIQLQSVQSAGKRRALAEALAYRWARQDINHAWDAVAASALLAVEKQALFTILWN